MRFVSGNGQSTGETKFEGPPMVNEPVQTDCFRGRAFQSDSMGGNYAKMVTLFGDINVFISVSDEGEIRS